MVSQPKSGASAPRPSTGERVATLTIPARNPFASVLGGLANHRAQASDENVSSEVTSCARAPKQVASAEPDAATFGSSEGTRSNQAGVSPSTVDVSTAPDVESVFATTVSRIAWGGTGDTPLVRMQLAQGAIAGAELLVERNARGIRVRLSGLSVSDRNRFREAIERRLENAQLLVDEIDVE